MARIKKSDTDVISPQFPVVGIGASAGGLQAVKLFLAAIPEKSGMAYVFVQHLSPKYESFLPEILEKSANIPVHQITDNIHLEPDHLYIIPENKIVTTVDGVLKLAPINDKHNKVKVIDVFFSSLAVVHQSFAVGIILSGTLNDGTLGLQVIKAYGGITFAQDEASATFDAMPQNAIRSGAVDFILPPGKIAEHLLAINYPFHSGYTKAEIENTLPEHDEDIFKQLLTVLRVRRGIDFTYYKPSTLKRRIIRRMALNVIKNPSDYLVYLRENKPEQDALYNDMLISVTQFFRDPNSFDLLCKTILPTLVRQKSGNDSLRIWIAGCATGEEAYSMAICLQEYLGDKAAAMKIQIFATDISETAITKARTGIYRPMDVEGISSSRLQQFFTKLDGQYQVNKVIRDMCIFAHHNILKDPPFSRVDLISCRNVLIYLEPILQKKALTTFHYALNEQGFLMLGKSESVGKNADMFLAYNNHEKIFRRNGTRGRFMQVTSHGREQNFRDVDKTIQKESGKQDVFKIADEIILAQYAPVGVLVDEQFDIIQFRGVTSDWLALSPGKASLNLLRMANESLAFELRNLLHLAKKTNAPAKKEGVLFTSNKKQQYVNMEVVPLIKAADLHYLVLFENGPLTDAMAEAGTRKKQRQGADPRDQEIEQLKKELLQARADMKIITEDQEAVNEELLSANQELLSGSEELQSLNEELETSKEELQSTNEEITIINNELHDRNDQLNSARSYTEGVLNTVRDPLIILDKDLRVKRATDGFYSRFKVTEKETEGQYFYELGNRQWDIPELRNLLEGILPEKKSFDDFETTHVFPGLGRKIMRLNARQLKVNGEEVILLAIEDITDRRKVEEGLAEVERLFFESKERLKLAVDAAGLGTWDYNSLTGDMILDNRCRELFNFLPDHEMVYSDFLNMIHPADREDVDKGIGQALNGNHESVYEKEFRTAETKERKTKWIKSRGKAYFNSGGVAYRLVGTSFDITEQKKHDESTLELLKQKDDFISIASHELKTPITTLKASLQLIERMKDNPSPQMLPRLVENSIKSLGKVNVLIEELLNVSRLNHGQLHLNKKWFNIAGVVEDCCGHVHAEGLYAIKCIGDMALQVNADANRIEQVVVNFINNALKYAPESKEVIVKIEKLSGWARVSVIDKGEGIPTEKLTNLFDRYYRVDSGGSQYSGLGLGLYICAEIIKKHNGKIGVDSVVGEGSTFWFTLPV